MNITMIWLIFIHKKTKKEEGYLPLHQQNQTYLQLRKGIHSSSDERNNNSSPSEL